MKHDYTDNEKTEKIEIPLDVQQRMLQFFFEINLKKYLEEEGKNKNASPVEKESV